MLTKDDVNLNVVGQAGLDNTVHYIVKLDAARYVNGVLYTHILVPRHNFPVTDGEWVEVVAPTPTPTPPDDKIEESADDSSS